MKKRPLIRLAVLTFYSLLCAFISLSVSAQEQSPVPVLEAAQETTDWSQAPIECVEDVIPRVPDDVCLDLTLVADPTKDFPADFTEDQIAEWKRKRKVLTYCRFQEVTRRETETPGSQSPDSLKVAWMLNSAIEDRDNKVAAVYKASRDFKIPFTILAGAIRQESLFASLGISPDGDNYSCSIAQFNIVGWCNWVNKQSSAFRKQLSWPSGLSCNELTAGMVQPFYDIGVSKLGTTPVYKLNWEHFKDIQLEEVKSKLGGGTDLAIANKFQAAMSFAKHCANPIYGINAKANEIARIYQAHIPSGLKKVQHYTAGQAWPKQCREKGYEGSYPFHAGWLLSVGMYNAGPRILNTLSHYWGWTNSSVADPATFANITPREIVEGLYWGGKYTKKGNYVTYNTLGGSVATTSWFKMCVAQRHTARVVQHSTQVGIDALVDSLEGDYGCSSSTYAAPDRQTSSGVKIVNQEVITNAPTEDSYIEMQ